MIDGFFRPTPAVSEPTTVPAPIGGLNAFDSIAGMSPTDAVELDNFYPQPYGVAVRNGSKLYSMGLTGFGNSESLMVYNGSQVDGTGDRLIQAYPGNTGFGGGVWLDITDPINLGIFTLNGSFNSRWQYTNIANSGGNNLIAFNGDDNGVWYNGVVYARLTAGNGIDPGTWSGVDPRDLIQTTVHQKRLWAVEKDSCRGWYLPVEQVFGVAQEFDFGPLFSRGGYLMALATWTLDGGSGADDHLLAISSEGEVAVYAGINPNVASDWTLQGVYFIGRPIGGRRCCVKMGGEAIIITEQGVVALSEALISTKLNSSATTNYSAKIQQLLSATIGEYGQNFGWEPFVFPALNMLIINTPENGQFTQLVANTVMRSWATFSGLSASCWALFRGRPYFVTSFRSRVHEFWIGAQDDTQTISPSTVPIRAKAIQAFNYMGSLGQNKHIKMYRPTFLAGSNFTLRATPLVDFATNTDTVDTPPLAPNPTSWDVALWDAVQWNNNLISYRNWLGGRSIGMAISVRLSVETNVAVTWVSTDWLLESGGVL